MGRFSITLTMEQSVLNQALHPYRRGDSVGATDPARETQMHAATLIEVRKHPIPAFIPQRQPKARHEALVV
jgi:hypothetical protein